ncbi:hypothetical protein ACFC18_37310 [Streptomyces sp. NPDC056121]|uniref:hypothetical protein n=1 Tax=Streptomyces sp. NPDC056121 TaxID=3345718 RepID=UPI0035DBE95A
MEITDRTPAPARAELLGAYWLDSPVLNGEACCCAAEAARPETGRTSRLWPVMLSAAVALVALACVVAVSSR